MFILEFIKFVTGIANIVSYGLADRFLDRRSQRPLSWGILWQGWRRYRWPLAHRVCL